MGWPYQFVDLTKAEKHERRLALDRYGAYAQLSALLPIAVLLIVRLVAWIAAKANTRDPAYDAVPGSPAAKYSREGSADSWTSTFSKVRWWLEDEVKFLGVSWGRKDQLFFGTLWTAWLLFLCFNGTGNDYFHLTKRFGIVATSQMPVEYLLALKYINPAAYAFRSSHEEVNRYHRVLGQIVYFLLCLHGIFYVNAWVQLSKLERFFEFIVIIGVAALLGMTLMYTTALTLVRQYSYRIFFVTHLIVAITLPVAIFFHVHHARVYMAEALGVFIVDLVMRKLNTVTAEASLEPISDTNLIKVVAKIPQSMAARFREHPAPHAYVNLPPASRPKSGAIFNFVFSPFTVASVNEISGELTLVLRQKNGPMTKALARFANSAPAGKNIPLDIEGPYGVAARFSNLTAGQGNRILLFAGGVGATFILPIYQHIISENPAARVTMIWAVREAGEATWPVASSSEKSIFEDDRVQIFLTGSVLDSDSHGGSVVGSGQVELQAMHKEPQGNRHISGWTQKRPDLKRIVDDAFREGLEDRVAVVICGPDGMAQELRSHVGKWVKRGRVVTWHSENFGW